MRHHALLCNAADTDGGSFSRVHTKNQNLSENSPSYTTLHALSTIVERYLVECKTPEKFSSWRPLVKGIYQRPDDESLDAGTVAMTQYFDALASVPSHEAFIQGKPAGDIRGGRGGRQHSLSTARADGPPSPKPSASSPIRTSRSARLALSLPSRRPAASSSSPIRLRRGSASSVTRSLGRCAATSATKRSAAGCFEYLLGGGIPTDVDREELRTDFASERRVDDDHAVDRNGKPAKLNDVRLPNPWR